MPALYPVGASIKINNIPFKVIGVLEEKGGTGGPGGNQDEVVMVPLSTAHERLFPRFHNRRGEPTLSVVYAQVVSEDRMDQASQEISDLLRQRHDIRLPGRRRFHRDQPAGPALDLRPDHERADDLPRRDRRHQPAGGRHRHHEYHAGVGHRADA